MSAAAPSRQRLWSAARVLRQFDATTLAMAASTTEAAALQYVRLLVTSGHIAQLSGDAPERGSAPAYRIARNSGPKAPYWSGGRIHDPNQVATYMTRAESARQRVWSAARKIDAAFDVPTIAARAKTPRTTAADYIRQLARSGHVRIVGNGNGKVGSTTTYRLVRDSGPSAPVFRETSMFDPNTGRSWPTPARREVRRRDRAGRQPEGAQGRESVA